MKKKLKSGAVALRTFIVELTGSVSGYSTGTMILSAALTSVRLLSRLLWRQKERLFPLKKHDIYIK